MQNVAKFIEKQINENTDSDAVDYSSITNFFIQQVAGGSFKFDKNVNCVKVDDNWNSFSLSCQYDNEELYKINLVAKNKKEAKKAGAYFFLMELFPEVIYIISKYFSKIDPDKIELIKKSSEER